MSLGVALEGDVEHLSDVGEWVWLHPQALHWPMRLE